MKLYYVVVGSNGYVWATVGKYGAKAVVPVEGIGAPDKVGFLNDDVIAPIAGFRTYAAAQRFVEWLKEQVA